MSNSTLVEIDRAVAAWENDEDFEPGAAVKDDYQWSDRKFECDADFLDYIGDLLRREGLG